MNWLTTNELRGRRTTACTLSVIDQANSWEWCLCDLLTEHEGERTTKDLCYLVENNFGLFHRWGYDQDCFAWMIAKKPCHVPSQHGTLTPLSSCSNHGALLDTP